MKKILFIIPQMSGGGAERVASQLLNEFYRCGYDCEMLLTSAKRESIITTDLNPEIKITLLRDSILNRRVTFKEYFSNALCKPFELLHKSVPAVFAKNSFVAQYNREIKAVRDILISNPDATAIAFLQPAIPILMFASDGLPNRVVFSERGDPVRLMKGRYGKNFIYKYYRLADFAVFQTEDAKKAYPQFIQKNSIVISNPIKYNLTEAYFGERNKTVVTFCRISLQKNLPLLINAFILFHKNHNDYRLRIIGDAVNEEGFRVKKELDDLIRKQGFYEYIEFMPFSSDVHNMILHDGMYVNSSDYEGISNAMLEAMAIGMPVICTDCPIGGARQTIKDGENGLLVPVNDVKALADAMSRIADNENLSAKLSLNASKIREELAIDKIAKKWMEIL